MALVEFVKDIYPHCKGDVVDLSADELKKVDAVAKARGVDAYKSVGKQEAKAGDDKKQPAKADNKK